MSPSNTKSPHSLAHCMWRHEVEHASHPVNCVIPLYTDHSRGWDGADRPSTRARLAIVRWLSHVGDPVMTQGCAFMTWPRSWEASFWCAARTFSSLPRSACRAGASLVCGSQVPPILSPYPVATSAAALGPGFRCAARGFSLPFDDRIASMLDDRAVGRQVHSTCSHRVA